MYIMYFALKFAVNFLVDVRIHIKVCGVKSSKLIVAGLTKRGTKNCNYCL